jgi:hypothetical protein
LLAYDRVLIDNVTLGGRLGYAFGGGPAAPDGKAFFPVHIEARAAYWFGTDPFIRVGVRPFILAGVGAAQFDGKVEVKVDNGVIAANTERLTMDAWKKMSIAFGTAGFGMMYAIDQNSGVIAELRGAAVFPTFGLAGSLQVAYSRGLF